MAAVSRVTVKSGYASPRSILSASGPLELGVGRGPDPPRKALREEDPRGASAAARSRSVTSFRRPPPSMRTTPDTARTSAFTLHIEQPHERPLSDRLMVNFSARSFAPQDSVPRRSLHHTQSPNGAVSQGREGPV